MPSCEGSAPLKEYSPPAPGRCIRLKLSVFPVVRRWMRLRQPGESTREAAKHQWIFTPAESNYIPNCYSVRDTCCREAAFLRSQR
eukprot:6492257-Amphidinium_carterae.3